MATNFTSNSISAININNTKYHIKSIPFHATMSDWEQDFDMADYIPKQGEIIIYDTDVTHDYARIKIGDGVNTILNLPFWHESIDLATMAQVNSAIQSAIGAAIAASY